MLIYLGHTKRVHCRFTFRVVGGVGRVPVERNHQCVGVICMTFRIIILLIIIINLGQILLSYFANTSRTHTSKHAYTHSHTYRHAHAHAPTHPPPSPFRLSRFEVSLHVRPTVTQVTGGWRSMTGRCFIQINSRAGDSVFAIVLCIFSRRPYTKIARTD